MLEAARPLNDVTGTKALLPPGQPWIVLASDKDGNVYEGRLDAGVPGVGSVGGGGASAFEAVGDGDRRHELDALVAELARDAETERAAVGDGEIAAVHAVGDEGLGMHGFGEVEAIPAAGFKGTGAVDEVLGLRQDSGHGEDGGGRDADPFGA